MGTAQVTAAGDTSNIANNERLRHNGAVITIRAATLEDLDDIVNLWNRAAGPTRHPGPRAEVDRLMARDSDSLLVADQDGCILGTVIVGWDGWRCHLYRLAVDENVRRSGVARRLLEEVTRRARAFGANRLDAMVNVDNVWIPTRCR